MNSNDTRRAWEWLAAGVFYKVAAYGNAAPAITSHQLRQFVMSLPEVEEQEVSGESKFKVQGKVFAVLSLTKQTMILKASLANFILLTAIDPETFAKPYGTYPRGWIRVLLPTVDPDLMGTIAVKAWRLVAPKHLIVVYDRHR